MDGIIIRQGRTDEAQAGAGGWVRAWLQAVPAVLPPIQATAEALRWFSQELLPGRTWFVAVRPGGHIVGVMVLGDGWIEQLYIEREWTRQGIGRRFVELAQQRLPGGIQLWTFQRNLPARAFYEALGFVAVELTGGQRNKGREPGVRYRWPPGGLPWPATMNHALGGLQSFTMQPLLALRDRAVAVLRGDERILAAWLVGSFVSGEADAFSDIDLHACVTDEAFEALTGDGWKDILARIMPAVMATSYPPAPNMAGGYAISPEWRHIDLAFWRRSAMPQALRSGHGFRALFDSAGVLPARAAERQPPAGEPYFPAAVVDLYFSCSAIW